MRIRVDTRFVRHGLAELHAIDGRGRLIQLLWCESCEDFTDDVEYHEDWGGICLECGLNLMERRATAHLP